MVDLRKQNSPQSTREDALLGLRLPDGGLPDSKPTPAAQRAAHSDALHDAKRRWSSVAISADTDPLSAYLNRLNHLAPLPASTQKELAIAYQEHGDAAAAQLLVLTNLRLVVKLAKEYQRRKTDLLELIQQGNLGLSEALTRYDPQRGVKFTSYAQYWIRAMILNYLMNHTHPVRIGGSRAGRKLFYNLKKARRALMHNGHKPTAERVAQFLDVNVDEVVCIAAQIDAPPVYLDAQAPGHEEISLGELMQSETLSPEAAAADSDLSGQIHAAIEAFAEQLPDARRVSIWRQRMVADTPNTLAELGEQWGVSKERIRQVEVGIRRDFRTFLLDRLGDDVELNWLN